MKNIQNPINPLQFNYTLHRPKPTSCNSEIRGFDTETKNGYAKIGASNNKYMEINNINDVFTFLCTKKNRSSRNFFFNLKFDFEVLFKHDLSILTKLLSNNQIETERYKIFYLNGKLLKITDKKLKQIYTFYDIFPFFLNSLKNASKKYLGLNSSELKGNRAQLFELYDNKTIGEYCIEDAKHTKLLAEYYIAGLNKINLYPRHIISCGNISEQYIIKNADIPTIKDVPTNIQNMAWYSYRGGWFDTWKRGFFPNAYQYDIKSAYPSVMKNLLDIRHGEWCNYVDEKQQLGVLKVIINEGNDSCVSTKLKGISSPSIYPIIDEPTQNYLMLSEYKELKKEYDIEIINAWSFIPNKLIYPYREAVNTLYNLKESSRKDKAKYIVIKQIYNSLYGKTIQKIKQGNYYKTGSLFNSIYGSEITAGCRLQMWKLIKENRKHILSIMTDGIITDKKLKQIKIGNELGDWTLEHNNEEVIILRTGVYQFQDQKPKRRGMVKLPNLKNVLAHNNKNTVTLTYTRPRHFKEMIIQKTPENIGVFLKDTKIIKINNDVKRIWLSEPKRARDLLNNSFNSIAIPNSLL